MPHSSPAQPSRVAAVILAAGTSARLGQPKQLLPLEGRPLLQHVVDTAHRGGVDEIVLVLGHAAEEIREALSLPPNARTLVNAHFAEGQSTSLRAGIGALDPGVEAALVLLGDQPGVSPAAVRAVIAASRAGSAPIVRARYSGHPGHPVLFAREIWREVCESTADRGARGLIASRPDLVTFVDLKDEPPPDVDTWDDYARLGG